MKTIITSPSDGKVFYSCFKLSVWCSHFWLTNLIWGIVSISKDKNIYVRVVVGPN